MSHYEHTSYYYTAIPIVKTTTAFKDVLFLQNRSFWDSGWLIEKFVEVGQFLKQSNQRFKNLFISKHLSTAGERCSKSNWASGWL